MAKKKAQKQEEQVEQVEQVEQAEYMEMEEKDAPEVEQEAVLERDIDEVTKEAEDELAKLQENIGEPEPAPEREEEVKKATPSPTIAKTKPSERKVIVIPKFTGRKHIGGQWYNFVAGQKTEVPESVKGFLMLSKGIYL